MSNGSADLSVLANWVAPLIRALDASQRRALMASVIREVRRLNQQSMRAQTAPDGSAWPERRRRIELRHSVRQTAQKAKRRNAPMMERLRLSKNLPVSATAAAAEMHFASHVLRVASVHHFGMPDRVAPTGPVHAYDARPLVGISSEVQQRIKEHITSWLSAQIKA